jgi:hypothetical protein
MSTTMSNGLDNFAWDQTGNGADPFNETTEVIEENGTKTKELVNEPETVTDESFLNTEENVRLETNEDDDGEEIINNEDDELSSEDGILLKNILDDLKEKNIIDFQLEEGKDQITVEEFLEIFQKNKDDEVNKEITSFAESLGEEGKAYIEFMRNGGKTADFIKLYLADSELPVQNIDSEKNQEIFLRYYLQTTDELSDDEIDEEIESIKEKGQLEKKAKRAFTKVNNMLVEERQTAIEQQKQIRKEEEQNRKQFITSLSSILKTKNNIQNFNITDKDRKELVANITIPSVVVGKNKITPIQAKLNEIYKDPEKLILFSKLVMNDFDTTDLEKSLETQTTKRTLKALQSKKNTLPNSRSGSTLAEIIKTNTKK